MILHSKMCQQKLNLCFQINSSVLLFLAIFLGQGLSSSKDKGGITYFDGNQNGKIKDRTMIRNNVYLIKVDCGNICNTSYDSEVTLHKVTKGKYVPKVIKEYDCQELFQSPLFDQPSKLLNPNGRCSSPRLDELPDDVAYEFTYGGRAQLFHYYYKLKNPEELSATVWMKENIDKLRSEFRSNKLFGSYGVEVVEEISLYIDNHMKSYIDGGHILVIGSESPWIEAILFEKGARHITVLDYGKIISKHPNISILNPDRMREFYMEGKYNSENEKFDAMVSFSSLEHSGLGRYGDTINPWGDLITMAKTKCITKKNSRVLVGVPSQFEHPGFEEYIGFNAGRVYGSIQLSHLFANWDQVYTEAIKNYESIRSKRESAKSLLQKRLDSYSYQPIYILQNT